jgi:hypothetical protein
MKSFSEKFFFVILFETSKALWLKIREKKIVENYESENKREPSKLRVFKKLKQAQETEIS